LDDICAGLTFDDIAKAIGRDEVWTAAAFYGQVRLFLAAKLGMQELR
jgi:cyanate lyase